MHFSNMHKLDKRMITPQKIQVTNKIRWDHTLDELFHQEEYISIDLLRARRNQNPDKVSFEKSKQKPEGHLYLNLQ